MVLKDIFKGAAAVAVFLAFASVLVFGLAAIVAGFKWLWALVPFGIMGALIGIIVIALTFFQTRYHGDKFSRKWFSKSFGRFGIGHKLAVLFGAFLIVVSQVWWFIPQQILNVLPSFRELIVGSFVFGILLYGVGGSFALAVKGIRTYWPATALFSFASIFVFTMINTPIWFFTESLPLELYIFGKILFLFFLILEIAYLLIFHVGPAFRESIENSADTSAKIKNEPSEKTR